MKRIFFFIIGLINCIYLQAEGTKLDNALFSGYVLVEKPFFSEEKNVKGETFEEKELLSFNYFSIKDIWPYENARVKFSSNEKDIWKIISTGKKGNFKLPSVKQSAICIIAAYLETEKWEKASWKLKSNMNLEFYVNGDKVISEYQTKGKTKEIKGSKELEKGKHIVLIKCLLNNKLENSISIESSCGNFSLNNEHHLTIDAVLNGKQPISLFLSPKGNYLLTKYKKVNPKTGKNSTWYEVNKTSNGELIKSFQFSNVLNLKWLPKKETLVYSAKNAGEEKLYSLDLETNKTKVLVEDFKGVASFNFPQSGDYIFYSKSEKKERNSKDMVLVKGMNDRYSWFRQRYPLYILDLKTGLRKKLIHGKYSSQVNDISRDGRYIAFSYEYPNYKERPFHKQDLFILDMKENKIKEVWKEKTWPVSVSFSPDAKDLLVEGGPESFGSIGVNVPKGTTPNSGDNQLYIYNIESKKVTCITKDFKPSVSSSYWIGNTIYLKVTDKDYERIYKYDLKEKSFSKMNLTPDVIKELSFNQDFSKLAFIGCGVSSPFKVYFYDLIQKKETLLIDPQKKLFSKIKFGEVKDWSFKSKQGQQIEGRVYFPPNFDASKKYPLIVNYYAGTVPVERSFGGRYPLNLYAANGYIVYLINPSGAIGYGQDFSAKHVNAWGKTTADEIIEGTKKFLQEHNFINSERVGCIGASYGGFMTMYLQTKTDIFTAAISHAGISSLASYWGEGYWGYSYSGLASANSYPWNSKELYVEQSPLFHADKINTPILLIHGSKDTNVPVGESIQMYTALKILGKDVEFLKVEGQDHQILDYKKRILWNNTIFAYFAKWLKDEPEWWNKLYPKENL